MPLIIDDDEIEKRVNHPDNAIIKYSGPGKPKGFENTQPRRTLKVETKAFLGALAQKTSVNNVAKIFDFKQSNISQFKNADTKSHHNVEIAEKQTEILQSSREVALDKLMQSLNAITENKLRETNPLIAASIAEKMASVHEKLGPKGPQVLNQSKIIYYAPRQKDESEYTIIETEAIGE